MLFQIYGDRALTQLFGWVLVFCGLVLMNEIARRTKIGGLAVLVAVPAVLTVYFIVIQVAAHGGAEWALTNQTYVYMGGWFHYAKLYAADCGCIGFMMIKYGWGIGKKHWFKAFPFVIVAINILIAVASDTESAIKGLSAYAETGSHWWYSNENVWLYGGWWNILNAIAGVLNILCMTGWWGVYSSKDKKDMLWPDMTVWFIVAYDIWNFEYTYLNLPIHSWYCGVALLLAPTFANAFWNKGGWIQNRANTLAIWCMFAQVLPNFQERSNFAVVSSVYGDIYAWNGYRVAYDAKEFVQVAEDGSVLNLQTPAFDAMANPVPQGVIAILAVAANVICLTMIIKRSIEMGKNPYSNDVWAGTKDYEEAMAKVDA